MRSCTSSRSSTERWIGRRTPETVAVRQPPVGASATPGPRMAPSRGSPPAGEGSGGRGPSSVTLVPLLAPGVTQVVVAVLLPEPRLVARHERQLADPLRALPEVEVRHQQSDRSAVLDRQRLAVELPHHPRLASGDVLEWQGGGVPGLRRRHDEVRLGGGTGCLEQRVGADAPELRVELRPGGHAVDVAAVLRRRQRVRLVPGPRGRGLDPAVDGDAPGLGRDPRGGLGGEDRPVVADVVLARRQPRVAIAIAAEEASGHGGHGGHSPTAAGCWVGTWAARATARTVSRTSAAPVRQELTEKRMTPRPCHTLAEGIPSPSASSRSKTSRVRWSDSNATLTCV